ncbi:hypothetical protein HID58_067106 [Brassica napus]|uniref:Secreted protein n=1 Tax=Brassica napus TaxID=3708 RepID=A0ABQ7ZHZ2_BRANA|nr:hypothetical protein HID58_067106 [Brassica napus]
MGCAPLGIYFLVVHPFGPCSLRNGFVALLLSTFFGSGRICRSKKGQSRAWTGSFCMWLQQRGRGRGRAKANMLLSMMTWLSGKAILLTTYSSRWERQ